MNILITRPYNLAIHSQSRISKLGKKSVIIPFIKINYLAVKIEDNNYNYIILTSQNAITTFENNLWMKDKSILVVGEKTKEILLQKNCKKILFSGEERKVTLGKAGENETFFQTSCQRKIKKK